MTDKLSKTSNMSSQRVVLFAPCRRWAISGCSTSFAAAAGGKQDMGIEVILLVRLC
ncbi:MAG: hypothetical protein JWM11_6536 [Planctomycetaceae bacterium]|nr:hypothetical protein [Planctomycetaceae bacterium]